MDFVWDVIVITCNTFSSLVAIEKEVQLLQKKGQFLNCSHVLVIEDPAPNIGSGAATLNALLVATEYLSSRQHFMVITADVLTNSRILILHHGRDYLYSTCGKSFISLPKERWPVTYEQNVSYSSGIYTNFEILLEVIKKLSHNCPPGVWVSSTDMLLLGDEKDLSIQWETGADAILFCALCDTTYATNHGTVSIDDQGYVADIIYRGSIDAVEQYKWKNGCVPIVSGIIFLSAQIAESLLSLYVQHPLDSCTYMGLDSGADPIQVSLFFDILIAMASRMTKDVFLSGNCGKTYNMKVGFQTQKIKNMLLARSLVWNELSKYKMAAVILEKYQHFYWADDFLFQNHAKNLRSISFREHIHSIFNCCDNSTKPTDGNSIVNSIINVKEKCKLKGASIYHSKLEVQQLYIGKNCFLFGLDVSFPNSKICIPDNTVILKMWLEQEFEDSVTVIFGTEDNLLLPFKMEGSTFGSRPWSEFFKKFQVTEDDLWSVNLETTKKSLYTAKLYPCNSNICDVLFLMHENVGDSSDIERWKSSQRFSISEIFGCINYTKSFERNRNTYAKIASRKIKDVLCRNENYCLLPYIFTACAEGWHDMIMHSIDSILLSETNPFILSRSLSTMADLLGTMAGKCGGLRSGPGGNKSWSSAFNILLNGNTYDGMLELKKERDKWLSRPDHLMRAARHYERAVQILIQVAVHSADQFMITSFHKLPSLNNWIIAESPARIDIYGGWTDTPPICYELGGSVVNIAVLINGKKPIGAKAKLKPKPTLVFKTMNVEGSSSSLDIENMEDLLDYNQPFAQGALLKAAVICTNIVNIHSNISLHDQLLQNFNAGIEVQSWSHLPQGCGLGTSSILASCIIAVLWSVYGKKFDNAAIIHAVLNVEQLLTTGGGWQDQIGGLIGGIKRGYSEASLPLHVKYTPMEVSSETIRNLNQHLLLIYTGKVRLAKNLLQNVIRNWYARDKTFVDCFNHLLSTSVKMEEALIAGDLKQMGSLMNDYWEQKKILAPGCEPASVKKMMEVLNDLCYGLALTGAGGGGFMCILTKEPNSIAEVKDKILELQASDKITVYEVSVDLEGLTITN